MRENGRTHRLSLPASAILAFIMLALVPQSNCLFRVLSPNELKRNFVNDTISTNYANFGHIPYGHSIMGSIYFDKNNSKACHEYSDPYQQNKSVSGQGEWNGVAKFMVAWRGDCTFVTKVRHMETAGAAVGIIVDSNSWEDIQFLVMSDDGTGGGISIPSLMISNQDGEKLLNYYKSVEQTQDPMESTINVMISFDLDKPDNRVEYDVWYTSSNDKALDFLEDFAQTDGTFGDSVLMTPHFVFWKCPYCDDDFLLRNCYGQGRYCAVEEKDDAFKLDGTEIVQEDLRQKCIYDQYYNKAKDQRHVWWDYIQFVHINCRNQVTQDCSKNAHKSLGIPYETTWKCVTESFSESDWHSKTVVNSIIEKEIAYWKTYGSGLYPSVVINNKTFRGQLDSLAVFNALCAGFKEAPTICRETLGIFTPKGIQDFRQSQPGGVPTITIFFIVLAVVLVNVLFVYCCRRKQKREFRETMDMQIESTINQYKALSKSSQSTYIR